MWREWFITDDAWRTSILQGAIIFVTKLLGERRFACPQDAPHPLDSLCTTLALSTKMDRADEKI